MFLCFLQNLKCLHCNSPIIVAASRSNEPEIIHKCWKTPTDKLRGHEKNKRSYSIPVNGGRIPNCQFKHGGPCIVVGDAVCTFLIVFMADKLTFSSFLQAPDRRSQLTGQYT